MRNLHPATRKQRVRRSVAMALTASTGLLGLATQDPAFAATDVGMAVDLSGSGRVISSLIYGTNNSAGLSTTRQTLVRLGGNRWTAFNWENNASNAGSDWCFQNDGLLSASNTPGAAVTPALDAVRTAKASAMVTVPIVDYVAADKNGGCDVRNSGPNYLQTRFRQNRSTSPGAPAATPNPNDAYVYQNEYVAWLRARYGSTPVLFSLDNEPDLWSSTHAEVHPNPVTYAELVQRTITYAASIKTAWPGAPVAGPVSYGFYGFERLQGAPDANNRNFLDFYLQQMRQAGAAQGRRLVDLLDLHWYPEAQGNGVRVTGTDTSAAVVEARVQAPRSLWDPAFLESSWITAPNQYNYGPIRLIPRTKDRIAAHYPGTGVAFTEWNYGGGGHISGAIATADVLGIFGREDVKAASMWELNADERFTYAAFRAFRNYDGAGSSFGNRSQPAISSNVTTASVYASTFANNPGKAVVVAINKATAARSSTLSITPRAGFGYRTAKVYALTAAGPTLVAQPTLTATGTNTFTFTMPAQSVSVIVPQV